MEILTTIILLQVITTTKLVEYGTLGIAVITLASAVKVLYTGRQKDQEKAQQREQELEDKIFQFSNKSIEVNSKVANALENNNKVLNELKGLLTEHIINKGD